MWKADCRVLGIDNQGRKHKLMNDWLPRSVEDTWRIQSYLALGEICEEPIDYNYLISLSFAQGRGAEPCVDQGDLNSVCESDSDSKTRHLCLTTFSTMQRSKWCAMVDHEQEVHFN